MYIKSIKKIPKSGAKKREYSRKAAKKLREKRKKNGICYNCGKVKADKGFVSCSWCREKFRNNKVKRNRGKREKRSELRKQKLCTDCGWVVAKNSKFVLCITCREKRRLRQRRLRKKKLDILTDGNKGFNTVAAPTKKQIEQRGAKIRKKWADPNYKIVNEIVK